MNVASQPFFSCVSDTSYMLAHPDDDRAEAGPGVEPGVEHGELADHLPLFDE